MDTAIAIVKATDLAQLFSTIESMNKRHLELLEQIKDAKADRWLTIEEVSEYTGFSLKWIRDRKEEIGYFQDGGGTLKFTKAHLDRYFTKRFIQKKVK